MIAIAAIALGIAAAGPAAPAFDGAHLFGFTPDGKLALFNASIGGQRDFATGKQDWYYLFFVALPADGAAPLVYRDHKELGGDHEADPTEPPPEQEISPAAEQAWNAAETTAARQTFLDRYLDDKGLPLLQRLPAAPRATTTRVALGNGASVALELAGDQRCPTAKLVLTWNKRSAALAEEPCPADAAGLTEVKHEVESAWSPDQRRVALSWTVVRRNARGKRAQGSARLAIASARSVATVDLLDAGASASLDGVAAQVGSAGFKVAHRGKAVTKRRETAVYYAPGYDADARDLAPVVGAAPQAVQPLSWKSPYSITIAVGSAAPAKGR